MIWTMIKTSSCHAFYLERPQATSWKHDSMTGGHEHDLGHAFMPSRDLSLGCKLFIFNFEFICKQFGLYFVKKHILQKSLPQIYVITIDITLGPLIGPN